MKKAKVLFWITTIIIFLFEGITPILTSRTPLAISGVTHLGYPIYFSTMLAVFKLLGALALVIPTVAARIKEWAYAGFGIDFISALVSYTVVDGFGIGAILPLIFMVILVISYTSYHKMRRMNNKIIN